MQELSQHKEEHSESLMLSLWLGYTLGALSCCPRVGSQDPSGSDLPQLTFEMILWRGCKRSPSLQQQPQRPEGSPGTEPSAEPGDSRVQRGQRSLEPSETLCEICGLALWVSN